MPTVSLSDFLQFSVPERLQLVQDLWDSLAALPEDLPVSEAQRLELLRRSEANRQNPDAAASLDEVLDRIERSIQ